MPAISEETITPNTRFADDESLFSGLKDGQWKVTKFQTTPPMSSYIVAFANGHFKYLEDSVVLPLSGKTLPLRIYSQSRSFLTESLLYLMRNLQQLRNIFTRHSLLLISRKLFYLSMKRFLTWVILSPSWILLW
jgi:hypothetical protein